MCAYYVHQYHTSASHIRITRHSHLYDSHLARWPCALPERLPRLHSTAELGPESASAEALAGGGYPPHFYRLPPHIRPIHRTALAHTWKCARALAYTVRAGIGKEWVE